MKKILTATVALAMAASMSASGEWSFQSKTFTVDTVYHAKIGPGTTTTSLELRGSQRLNLFYTTIDLTDPNIDIRVVKASNSTTANQTLSTMQRNASHEGAQYIIGTNADFFAGTNPCGSTVVDGSIFNVVNSGFDNFWMTADRKPHIGGINFSGKVSGPNGEHALHGINTYRNENQVIIYQRFAGNNVTTAPTNNYGAELTIEPIEGELSFEGTVKYRVTSEASTNGGGTIPAGGAILAGHGSGKTFVQGLHSGDIITVTTTPAVEVGGKVMQMASGCPMILKDGQVLETQGALDHLTSNQPRTAVGYSADRTKVVLMVVDGRGTSVGCVSKTLAGIMAQVGCADAMNFDGGGSSCLYSKDLGVRNRPSDGKERAVVNSVWAVATSPTDNVVAEIRFESPSMTLPRYAYYTPRVYGYNKYGVLLDLDLKGFTLSCDPALGVPAEDPSTLFANGSGTHVLTATYNGATATMPVTIGSAQPRMRLGSVLVDSHRDYKAEVVADVNGTDMPLDNSALVWSSSDNSIATVDEAGNIRGVADGSAIITGTVAEFKGELPVKVEVPANRYYPVMPSDNIADWGKAGTGAKNVSVARAGEHGVAVTYTVSSTRLCYVTAKATTPTALYSLPDSIRMVINPGDAKVTKIRIKAAGPDVRPDGVTYENISLTANADNVFEVPVSDFIDTRDFINYPLTFTDITFYVGDANASTHTISVPELDGVYTSVKDDQGVDNIVSDSFSGQRLIAESCVSAGQELRLNMSGHWTVYSLGGSIVASGNGDSISTAGMQSGMYVVTCTAGTQTLSAKALVK